MITGPCAHCVSHCVTLIDSTDRFVLSFFFLCRSFVPKGGEVIKVTVYPSDYGLQRMAEEAELGPKVWKDNKCETTLVFYLWVTSPFMYL